MINHYLNAGPAQPMNPSAHRPPITGIPTGASDQEKASSCFYWFHKKKLCIN